MYADKSITSSSGTKKLYPVVARLANLPREIRNGRGIGAGQVVALLPVVSGSLCQIHSISHAFQITNADIPEGLSDAAIADYKCAVWHGGMQKLLDTIRVEAQVGHTVELDTHFALGLERKAWRLFPTVSIIAAVYEEQ